MFQLQCVSSAGLDFESAEGRCKKHVAGAACLLARRDVAGWVGIPEVVEGNFEGAMKLVAATLGDRSELLLKALKRVRSRGGREGSAGGCRSPRGALRSRQDSRGVRGDGPRGCPRRGGGRCAARLCGWPAREARARGRRVRYGWYAIARWAAPW
ncbi:unnamed protein product [Prorocentrum cordatum]|uniref:Uncharacterized protein n=1 Tax=Prorocentrum cordatum TaxID=2364126 RepID=A0ABN9TNC1_9DINO|nr:unnamed protein product [Polarella glacialis]